MLQRSNQSVPVTCLLYTSLPISHRIYVHAFFLSLFVGVSSKRLQRLLSRIQTRLSRLQDTTQQFLRSLFLSLRSFASIPSRSSCFLRGRKERRSRGTFVSNRKRETEIGEEGVERRKNGIPWTLARRTIRLPVFCLNSSTGYLLPLFAKLLPGIWRLLTSFNRYHRPFIHVGSQTFETKNERTEYA